MKFINFASHIFAVFFVFAIPVSANALDGWLYDEQVDAMTDETWSTASIANFSTVIESEGMAVSLAVSCLPSGLGLAGRVKFFGGPDHYEPRQSFNITARFDQKPAFEMQWLAGPGYHTEFTGEWVVTFITSFVSAEITHGEKFLRGLRTSKTLRLRPEQQSDVYTLSLSGGSSYPLDRVLRDCGRDDLID